MSPYYSFGRLGLFPHAKQWFGTAGSWIIREARVTNKKEPPIQLAQFREHSAKKTTKISYTIYMRKKCFVQKGADF